MLAALEGFLFLTRTPQSLNELEQSKIISGIRFDPAPQLVDLFLVFLGVCFDFQRPDDPFRML